MALLSLSNQSKFNHELRLPSIILHIQNHSKFEILSFERFEDIFFKLPSLIKLILKIIKLAVILTFDDFLLNYALNVGIVFSKS